MKKIDLVISNPPFNNGVDISILKNVFEYAKKVMFIHPSYWALEKKGNEEFVFKNNKHLVELDLFWQNDIFNIDLRVPMSISMWDMENEYDKVKVDDREFEKNVYYANPNEISYFGTHYADVKEFVDIFSCFESIYDHRVELKDWNSTSNNVFTIPRIRGHIIKKNNKMVWDDDFFTMISNQDDEIKKRMTRQQFLHDVPQGDNDSMGWDFGANNPTYPQNFMEFLKTYTQRFLLAWFKINGNNHRGEIKAIPWLDWSKKWNDKMIFDTYVIPYYTKTYGEEQGRVKAEKMWDFIVSFIPKYYDDYVSGM